MSAEYNKYIDNIGLRITLIAVGFAVWAAAVVGLLSI
jgi:hypothetical protein